MEFTPTIIFIHTGYQRCACGTMRGRMTYSTSQKSMLPYQTPSTDQRTLKTDHTQHCLQERSLEPRLSGCQVLSGAVRRLSSCQVSGGCQVCVRWLSSLSGCEDARTAVRLSGDCQVVRLSGCQVLSGAVRCCQVVRLSSCQILVISI